MVKLLSVLKRWPFTAGLVGAHTLVVALAAVAYYSSSSRYAGLIWFWVSFLSWPCSRYVTWHSDLTFILALFASGAVQWSLVGASFDQALFASRHSAKR